jgi:hypothetical protein
MYNITLLTITPFGGLMLVAIFCWFGIMMYAITKPDAGRHEDYSLCCLIGFAVVGPLFYPLIIGSALPQIVQDVYFIAIMALPAFGGCWVQQLALIRERHIADSYISPPSTSPLKPERADPE